MIARIGAMRDTAGPVAGQIRLGLAPSAAAPLV